MCVCKSVYVHVCMCVCVLVYVCCCCCPCMVHVVVNPMDRRYPAASAGRSQRPLVEVMLKDILCCVSGMCMCVYYMRACVCAHVCACLPVCVCVCVYACVCLCVKRPCRLQ